MLNGEITHTSNIGSLYFFVHLCEMHAVKLNLFICCSGHLYLAWNCPTMACAYLDKKNYPLYFHILQCDLNFFFRLTKFLTYLTQSLTFLTELTTRIRVKIPRFFSMIKYLCVGNNFSQEIKISKFYFMIIATNKIYRFIQ